MTGHNPRQAKHARTAQIVLYVLLAFYTLGVGVWFIWLLARQVELSSRMAANPQILVSQVVGIVSMLLEAVFALS